MRKHHFNLTLDPHVSVETTVTSCNPCLSVTLQGCCPALLTVKVCPSRVLPSIALSCPISVKSAKLQNCPSPFAPKIKNIKACGNPCSWTLEVCTPRHLVHLFYMRRPCNIHFGVGLRQVHLARVWALAHSLQVRCGGWLWDLHDERQVWLWSFDL